MGNALSCLYRTVRSDPVGTDNITLTYILPGSDTPVIETFDYLVVACDPRALPFSARTDLEQEVAATLTSFTFHTSLYKARRPRDPELPSSDAEEGARRDVPNYAVRFNPEPLSRKDGGLYGFRDEVMARDPSLTPSANNTTWLTMYQLDGRGLLGRDAAAVRAELSAKRESVLNDPDQKWLNFRLQSTTAENANVEQVKPDETALVDYFPHFDPPQLDALLPWKIRDAQGDHHTLYVSSFTCFESVLHCYLYAAELMDPDGRVVRESFPTNKAARIAVVGAGPSGIMFSCLHLARNGYTNFRVFERSDRFGGKTITIRRPNPADPSVTVPCELGTCYLSLGYEPMYWLFDEYDAGGLESLDKGSSNFRSIVDPAIAQNDEERENGINYNTWTLRKNGPYEVIETVSFYAATVKYIVVHYATMGMTMEDCMPAVPPTHATVAGNLHRVFVDSVRNALFGLGDGNAGDEVEARPVDEQAEKEKEETAEAETELERRGGKVPAKDVLDVLRRRRKDNKTSSSSGLFGKLAEFRDDLDTVQEELSETELRKACDDVFRLPFAAFLDKHGMGDLKSTFVYAYQVQGYGTIETIPTYYGFVWITPAVMLGSVSKLFSSDPEVRALGTVNVMKAGWLRLWKQMVGRHLSDKIVFNADITNIERKWKE